MFHADYFHLPPGTLEKKPELGEDVFIAPGAQVIGGVRLGKQASVWYNAVVRGDINEIAIGERTNIQDGSVIHVESKRACVIGSDVVVGHHVNLHACVIEDAVLIGIGAIVLSGAVVGKGSVIGAGALVLEGQVIPPNSVAVGSPARVIKPADADAVENHIRLAAKYVELARRHRDYLKENGTRGN